MGIKETSMGIPSRCGKRKALPEALIHIYSNSLSGMHNLKYF